MTGYCILAIGINPHYRIVWANNMSDVEKKIRELRKQHYKTETLHMIGGDTFSTENELAEGYITCGQ